MALYPVVRPASVNPLAVVVICPSCGAEESQRMVRPGRAPINPGDKVLFRALCAKAASPNELAWHFTPSQTAYYIQFPTPDRRTLP